MALIWQTDFNEQVTPKGGVGKWASRLGWSRLQPGAPRSVYSDAATDPGTSPHPIIDGKRHLRSEFYPVVEDGRVYPFSCSMLSAENWFGFLYGYFEWEVILQPLCKPYNDAAWFMPWKRSGPPELDAYEAIDGQWRCNIIDGIDYSPANFRQDSRVIEAFKPDGVTPAKFALNWYPNAVEYKLNGVGYAWYNKPINIPMFPIFSSSTEFMGTQVRPSDPLTRDTVLIGAKLYQDAAHGPCEFLLPTL